MNIKKIMAATLACALSMSFVSMTAVMAMDSGDVYDDDDNSFVDVSVSGETTPNWSIQTGDTILPAKTFYVALGTDTTLLNVASGRKAEARYVADKDYFSFKLKKDTNSKYIKNVTVEEAKRIAGVRANFLKFELNDYLGVDDIKTDGTITFTARKNWNDAKVASPNNWNAKDVITMDYTLWLSNDPANNDDTIDAGDRFYFSPEKNETNTLIWGGDRDIAALRFEADNDAAKFYARLSTKVAAELWEEYGDPADAELWCYDFVNHPSIPATSRATLTLGIPWSEDEAYAPAPEDCFIYSYVDGELTDVTESFSYSDDAEEIPGWSIKTRTLGTYIVSDTELEIGGYEETTEEEEPTLDDPTTDENETVEPIKPIPNTGSSDMVNVAVVAAVVSLAAAGAVAFRKAK